MVFCILVETTCRPSHCGGTGTSVCLYVLCLRRSLLISPPAFFAFVLGSYRARWSLPRFGERSPRRPSSRCRPMVLMRAMSLRSLRSCLMLRSAPASSGSAGGTAARPLPLLLGQLLTSDSGSSRFPFPCLSRSALVLRTGTAPSATSRRLIRHALAISCRCTDAYELRLSGSLCEARRMASFAISGETPSISNSILPGRTTATQ